MKKLENERTELVFIIDESGSMAHLKSDTIGGFNSLVEKQKKQKGACLVTTVLFNDSAKTVHDRVALEEIEKMTEEDYVPSGCTALFDAIGETVARVTDIHKYARKEDVPKHTLFVITTDGLENASRRYTAENVRKMIERQKESAGWDFLFIGANIDSVSAAEDIGITADRAVNYRADEKGTKVLYEDLCCCISTTRGGEKLTSDWCADIADDYEKRK